MKDYYIELVNKSKSHEYLYHYTSLDSLELILSNGSLKCSRLDMVNDSEENKRITDPWSNRVFALCFSHELNNLDYFYNNYGEVKLTFKRSNIKINEVFYDTQLTEQIQLYEKGSSNRDYREKTNWKLFDSTFADVLYVDDLKKYVNNNGVELNAGLIKSKKDDKGNNWEFEAETRLRLSLKPLGLGVELRENKNFYPETPFKMVYIPCPVIESIELAPVRTKEQEKRLKELCNQYAELILPNIPT